MSDSREMNVDQRAADAARDGGMAVADEHAEAQWKAEADAIIDHLARTQPEVVSDDVWEAGLAPNPTGSSTALGPRFRNAAATGLISKTGRARRKALESCHASPMTIWASLVFEGERVPEADRAALAVRCSKAATWIEQPTLQLEASTRGREALVAVLRQAAEMLGEG